MTTIIDVLKSDDISTRITVGHRWLVWHSFSQEWAVYEAKRYARNTTEIVTTPDESLAVAYLIGDM